MNPGKIVRAPKFDDRTLFRYPPSYRAEPLRAGSRLVGLSGRRGRVPGRRRDVQQQRRLPQARGRGDVPFLSRHARRAACDARARQYAAARAFGRARQGGTRLRQDGAGARALRLLQGVQARMPDRRRHGAHEDRGRRRARETPRLERFSTGSWASLPRYAPLACAFRLAPQSARPRARRGARSRKGRGLRRRAPPPRLALRFLSRARRRGRPRHGTRGRALRRQLQPLFRAADDSRRARRARRRRLSRASAESAIDGSSRPLCCGRSYLSTGEIDDGTPRGEAFARGACPFCRARRAHHRARALVPA